MIYGDAYQRIYTAIAVAVYTAADGKNTRYDVNWEDVAAAVRAQADREDWAPHEWMAAGIMLGRVISGEMWFDAIKRGREYLRQIDDEAEAQST